jgi:hypothetical protein
MQRFELTIAIPPATSELLKLMNFLGVNIVAHTLPLIKVIFIFISLRLRLGYAVLSLAGSALVCWLFHISESMF